MFNFHKRSSSAKMASAILAAILGLNIGTVAKAADQDINTSVDNALKECRHISSSCADEVKNARGVLVFPHVVKADLIVGGAGGKGALVENGRITGYYDIGAASAGLQIGAEKVSQVYVFRSADSLARLKQGSDWKVGATADVALITSDANARSASGNVLAYVFNAKGLDAGVSVDAFDVWKDGQARPSRS